MPIFNNDCNYCLIISSLYCDIDCIIGCLSVKNFQCFTTKKIFIDIWKLKAKTRLEKPLSLF